jgi:hypothetical protein
MYEVVMFQTVPYNSRDVRQRKSGIHDAYRSACEWLTGAKNRAVSIYCFERTRYRRGAHRRFVGKFTSVDEIPQCYVPYSKAAEERMKGK